MITENYAITFDPDEWVKELGERQKELVSMIMVEDGLMLKDFVSGFMTRPTALLEGRAFAAMSATVDDVDGILNIKETFKRVVDSGHKVYLYMIIKNSGCGTKTIRYAIL